MTSYRPIERGEVKISLVRLERGAPVLGVQPNDNQFIYSADNEFLQLVIATYEASIADFKAEIRFLRGVKERQLLGITVSWVESAKLIEKHVENE